MDNYLLPRTSIAFQKNLVNHFGAFIIALKAFRSENYPDLKHSTLGVVELPRMRMVMPYNETMYETVCIPKKARVPGSRDLV
jgi:hypothetical protein